MMWFFLAAQWFFLLYFLALNAVYAMLIFRALGGVAIGRLGIVDVSNAADLADVLHAVGKSWKA